MYNKYWINHIAIKNKILGPIVPTNAANIKGQYWILMTENQITLPFEGLNENTNNLNFSLQTVIQTLA